MRSWSNEKTLQVVMARIGHDAKIFKALSKADVVLSLGDLAAETNVDAVLLSRHIKHGSVAKKLRSPFIERLLRYYQSMRMITEVAEDQFKANNVTRALASPTGDGIVYL